MPDQITPTVDPNKIEEQNADVKAKLEAQQLAGKAGAGEADPLFADAGKALDDLATAKTKEKEEGGTPPPGKTTPPDVVLKTPAEDEAAKKKAEEEAAAAAKKAEDDKAKANDLFKDSPQLPAGASTKSHEAFAAIKIRAAQDLQARDKQIDELKKQLAERDERLKNPVPKELLAEVEELRKFRMKFDIDADPKFKEWDKKADAARDFIYAQFRKIPDVTDATIEQIKKAGGPENIDLEKFFESVKDPVMRRMVESKVADILQIKYERDQAKTAAKSDIDTYVKQREEQLAGQATAHFENTKAAIGPVLDEMDFMRELPETDPKAGDRKKLIEENLGLVREALSDNSPNMRAVLIGGTIRLFHERKIHAETVKENEALKAEVTDLKGKLDKIKASATTRLREGGAPPDGKTVPAVNKNEVDFSTRTGDALDQIAKQIAETRSKAAQ